MKETYTYPYPRASITADIVVLRFDTEAKFELLLIKRANEPFKNKWALPGGFLDMNETLLECAVRELEEETGISRTKLTPIGIYDQVGRDPRGRVITHVHSTVLSPSYGCF